MIQISNLQFNYRRKQPLFKDLSLQVNEGSVVGLLGKNGAGKSTLLKLLAGVLFPQGGQVEVLGQNAGKRLPSVLSDVFFVPEELDFPTISMGMYIRFTAPLYPRFSFEKMDKIMQEFELDKHMKLSKVSYGQKKKFLIAFALSTQCKMLILDEPTNGLDIPSKALFRKVVAGSVFEDQVVFISTHQVKDVENLIDKVMILEDGKIVLNRSLIDISNDFAFKTAYSTEAESALYHEEYPGGYKVIVPAGDEFTDVDIEVLFNAAVKGVNLN